MFTWLYLDNCTVFFERANFICVADFIAIAAMLVAWHGMACEGAAVFHWLLAAWGEQQAFNYHFFSNIGLRVIVTLNIVFPFDLEITPLGMMQQLWHSQP